MLGLFTLVRDLVFDSRLSRGLRPVVKEAKSSASLSGDVNASLEINHDLNKSSHRVARREKGMKNKHRKVTKTDSSTRMRIRLNASIVVRLIGVLVLTLLATGQIAKASTHG
jgi:hypothetical protein